MQRLDFKKIPDDEKLNAFKGLLKGMCIPLLSNGAACSFIHLLYLNSIHSAYQTEIDSLTKRCKSAENAFLNVYKVLAEAPDPYPLLEAAVDQTVKVAEAKDLEAELKRMKEENAELKRKLGETSSLEAAKKKAEARVETLEHKVRSHHGWFRRKQLIKELSCDCIGWW